ncbi:MAG: M48 family metallopeptidase, partial [Steroidobacteraceae bacterium]
ATSVPAATAQLRVSANTVVRQVGHPGPDDRSAASNIHVTMPERLRQAAWQPEQAIPLIFALLLNEESEVRNRQLDLVGTRYDAGTRNIVETLARAVADLHPMQRLPLAALAFPALRRRPRPQLSAFTEVLRALIDADGRVTLEEYCFATLIRLQVMDALNPAASHPTGRVKLPDVAVAIKDLLAILARYGHDDTASAERAYALGLQEVLPDAVIEFRPPADWSSALDRTLPRLDLLAPAGKELVVRALTRSISADGIVSVAESELLRTVCAALHCPLPPLLADIN